jgi:hypothetical protein
MPEAVNLDREEMSASLRVRAHRVVATLWLGVAMSSNAQENDWPIHSVNRPRPPVVDPGPGRLPVSPPSDAIVLFDGRTLDRWERVQGGSARWTVRDGYLEIAPDGGDIRTRDAFGDVELHVEFATPEDGRGSGQDRGNSGVYLMALYEVQVLDSYQNDTYADGQAAAIYGQFPPRVNASRPPGVWQSYDITFRAPRFDADGSLARPARITVRHNDVVVHDNVALTGPSAHRARPPYAAHAPKLPILLQDHGQRVRYRNIWLRELPPER